MARIRSIRPEFFTSETVAQLSVRARLTWIGLWTYCDDYGRGKDNVRLIHAALYPLDDSVTPPDVAADVDELEAAGRVRRYRAEGSTYLEVTNWTEHQKPNRKAESKIPAPSDGDYTPPPNGSQNGSGCFDSAQAVREQCADTASNRPDDVGSGKNCHLSSVNGSRTADAVREQCGSRPVVVVGEGEGEGEGVGEGGSAAACHRESPPARAREAGRPAGRTEHPSAAELDATAVRPDAFRIVARWAENNPGVTTGQRRRLGKAVEDLFAQQADPELIPAALDESHRSHWRDPVKSLPSAYDRVRRDAHPSPPAPSRTKPRESTTDRALAEVTSAFDQALGRDRNSHQALSGGM